MIGRTIAPHCILDRLGEGVLLLTTTPTSRLNHDVGPDGRFVSLAADTQSVGSDLLGVVIVENWFEDVKRLVPVKVMMVQPP